MTATPEVTSADSAVTDALTHPGIVTDTTDCSLVHHLYSWIDKRCPGFSIVVLYLGAVLVTYLPMLLAASHASVLRALRGAAVTLPFLGDWNISYAFLVSFPMLVLLLVTDEKLLTTSLGQVERDHILQLPTRDAKAIASEWKKRFRHINIWSQLVGLAVAVIIGPLTLWAAHSWVGSWIWGGDSWVACTYLFSISLLYAVIVVFVARCVAISVFLNAVVSRKTTIVSLQPFHPDRCAGLRPVGRLGLRNQYTVTVLGLNIVVLAVVTLERLPPGTSVVTVVVLATLAYLILGPVVFLGPLLPFHRCMFAEKQRAMSEVSERLRQEFERVRKQIPHGEFSELDEKLIDRLRKLGTAIDELPVWPFDARTLRRFASAYVIPLGAAILEEVLTKLAGGALHVS